MIYCINPQCQQRQNPEGRESCQSCGTALLVRDRYRLLHPLRPLDFRLPTEIFEVDDGGTRKVMKILKDDRPEIVDRFQREAITLRLLSYSGIPKADAGGYFTFTPQGGSQPIHGFIMEKVAGQNLENWISQHGSISQSRALKWLRQLVKILDVLHQNHFFHRDIKPSNIIRRSDDNLVLIDFGTTRGLTDTYLPNYNRGNITTFVSGGYTPQEQMDGKALPQSDFFALGRTFVHLLTGQHPSELPTHPKTGQLVWRNRAPQISDPLADFIETLMACVPYDRPQNTQWVLKNLTPWRLRLQSLQRFLNSPQFKLSGVSLLTLAFIYRLSFPWQAGYHYDRGIDALKNEQLDIARKYNERALKFAPNESKIYNNLGLICQKQNDRDCAEVAYETALKLEENPVTRYNLGGLYDDAGDFDRATANYEQAIASNLPVSTNATSDLARLYILQGNTAAAIVLTEQGLAEAPEDRENVRSALYKNLGWAYWIQGDNLEAEENLRDSIELNENRTDAYCLLALVLETQDREVEALDSWQNCIDKGSKKGVDVRTWQTIARQRLQPAKPDEPL